MFRLSPAWCTVLVSIALLALAACDSEDAPTPLDGAWVSRDSISVITSTGVVRGTIEDAYTFAVTGGRITGERVSTTRDTGATVLTTRRSRLTGTYAVPVFSLTLSDTESTFSISVQGTVQGATVSLFQQEGSVRIPFATLRRS